MHNFIAEFEDIFHKNIMKKCKKKLAKKWGIVYTNLCCDIEC